MTCELNFSLPQGLARLNNKERNSAKKAVQKSIEAR